MRGRRLGTRCKQVVFICQCTCLQQQENVEDKLLQCTVDCILHTYHIFIVHRMSSGWGRWTSLFSISGFSISLTVAREPSSQCTHVQTYHDQQVCVCVWGGGSNNIGGYVTYRLFTCTRLTVGTWWSKLIIFIMTVIIFIMTVNTALCNKWINRVVVRACAL